MVWLVGSGGLLGRSIGQVLTEKGIVWTGSDKNVDITQYEALERFASNAETASFSGHGNEKVRWVINCTACEDALVCGAENIARLCRSRGIRLIHMSDNSVFNGDSDKPYKEDDSVCPPDDYGRDMAQAEENIAKEMTQFYIVRTSALFGRGQGNFVYDMVQQMKENTSIKVPNIAACPTYADDVALVVSKLIEKSEGARSLFGKDSPAPYGIYHFCNAGSASLVDIAREVAQSAKREGRITKDVTVTSGGVECVKSVYRGVLDCTKITKALRLHIPSWKQSLDVCVKFDENKE